MMIHLFKNKKSPVTTHFHVEPRDFKRGSISLPLVTIKALNKAASILQDMSNGNYEIMVTRGYINWDYGRKIKAVLAKIIFCSLHWRDRVATNLLFNSNGHDDGFSVDILPYDARLQKAVKFLSWKNVMMGRDDAEKLLKVNSDLINLIDRSMITAGFIGHADPRERLQMHYRLGEENRT